MTKLPTPSRRNWESLLVNAIIILILLFAMLPIATTILISFKREADVTRKPPVVFPCDTPTSAFDLSACRWSSEGYYRVLAPKPSETSPFGIALTGNMLRIYLPNTLLYATLTSLLVVLLAGMAYYLYATIRLWIKRTDPFAVCLGMAPIAALTAIGIHSFSDFNLTLSSIFPFSLNVAAIIAPAINAPIINSI
jgi:ABC-type glycerol-3-phosphate transport system permease component